MSPFLLAAVLATAPLATGRTDYFVVDAPAERCVWPVRMTGPDLHLRQSGGIGSITFAALAEPVCRTRDDLFADGFEAGAASGAKWAWTLHQSGTAPASYSGTGCQLTDQSLMDRQSWFVVLACAEVAP